MSQASGTDDAEDQLSYNAEQPPPQIDAVGPIEEEIYFPLAELPPGISNAGPSQPSGPHEQGSTPNVPPVGDLAP
ncbi:hypothetical protein C8R48DRAFT_733822 [Suillus tomentosus]|nr:hypothetical protein C8R48DRAFT_733822 [Suillus tomentosus]